ERVTVDHPTEFCGGTHVAHTGQIGCFKIVSQEAVAKGVRRLTAVTGPAAFTLWQTRAYLLEDLALQLQCRPEEVPQRVAQLQEQMKKLQEQWKKGNVSDLTAVVDRLMTEAPVIQQSRLVVGQLPADTAAEAVRMQVDRLRKKLPSALVVFGWVEADSKVPLIVAVTSDLVQKGVKANELVKPLAEVVGGGGGGRPDFAQAGGKWPDKLATALELARQLGRQRLEQI
ncbi:MAG: DHHA1 domain-containing protein, partial [Gemmataceae bacterium]|nr:DHHA1 domain-containing protein [Gemmataceae bacterium]